MTHIERKSQQAIHKLNKVMRLTQELLNLQEEIALIENAKDFSNAVLIDAKGPGSVTKPVADTEKQARNRALFGPLAHTVKTLKRRRS